jgi:hypothetical protein
MFKQGTFTNDANMTPDQVARKRALIAAMLPKFGSARYVGEGIGQLATGVMAGRKNRQLDEIEGKGTASANALFERLMGTANSAQSPDMGPLSVLGVMPTEPAPVDPASPGAIAGDTMAAIGKGATHDHASHAGQSHAEWLRYSNQGATRNDPLDPGLVSAMSFLPDLGVTMDVVSGGQEPAGAGGTRTGSTRHDHGKAADVDFYKDGRKLDWNNPADLPILQEIVRNAKGRGVTGIGAGDDYMGAGRFHVGFGDPAVWGAGGKSANAPEWLVEAYNGAPAGAATSDRPYAPGTASADPGIPINELYMALQNPWLAPEQKAMITSMIARQEQAADPLRQLELQKAQIELAQLQNPQGATPDELIERRALAEAGGLQPGTPEYQTYILTGKMPGDAGAGGTEYGLTPQYGVNEKGEVVAIQFAKDGTSIATPLPEGVALSKGIEKLDLGDSYQYVNTFTGEQIGNPVPKNLRTAESEKQIGQAEGAAAGEAITGLGNAVAKGEAALSLIDQVANDPALPSILGIVQGNIPAGTPFFGGGQAGADLGAKIEQLQGQVFLEAFESLKGAGQITEIEGQKAERAKARLQRSQSPEAYRQALSELREVIQGGMSRARARASGAGASAIPAAPAANGGVVTITSDAEYDALPSGSTFVGPDGKTRRKP